MLQTKRPLEVRVTGFKPRLNTEGLKLMTVSLRMAEARGTVRGSLVNAINVMKENESLDGIHCDEEMESVRLEFALPATPSLVAKVFEITNLFKFSLAREKTTQAGTIASEKSGRIMVDFKFTVPLLTSGPWAVENFSNDLMMSIEKAQGELSLGGEPDSEENPDSQPARNKRIEDGDRDSQDPPAENVKAKRGRKKKI